MTYDIILTFTIISILLVVSPGPNGVLFLKTVPLYGKKSGMLNLFGIFTATYVHGALSFFGLSAIVLSSATLFMAIKVIGALYLLYLGIKSIYSMLKKNEDVKQNLQSQIKKDTNRSHKVSFIEGFLTQILNPKVSMFYLAAFPQFIDFNNAMVIEVFALVSIHAMTIFIWFTMFIFLVGKTMGALKSNFLNKALQGLTGTIFIYLSYKILNTESSK